MQLFAFSAIILNFDWFIVDSSFFHLMLGFHTKHPPPSPTTLITQSSSSSPSSPCLFHFSALSSSLRPSSSLHIPQLESDLLMISTNHFCSFYPIRLRLSIFSFESVSGFDPASVGVERERERERERAGRLFVSPLKQITFTGRIFNVLPLYFDFILLWIHISIIWALFYFAFQLEIIATTCPAVFAVIEPTDHLHNFRIPTWTCAFVIVESAWLTARIRIFSFVFCPFVFYTFVFSVIHFAIDDYLVTRIYFNHLVNQIKTSFLILKNGF